MNSADKAAVGAAVEVEGERWLDARSQEMGWLVAVEAADEVVVDSVAMIVDSDKVAADYKEVEDVHVFAAHFACGQQLAW